MTTPIAFTSMNKAVITDAADMPHVLGNPADATWKGIAERSNDNFAAINAYAAAQSDAVKGSAVLAGSGVIALNAGWSLTNGYIYASTVTFLGGAKFVHLIGYLTYTGATSTIGANGHPSVALTPGTLVPALRSPIDAYWRTCAEFSCTNATYLSQGCCDLSIAKTTGVLSIPVASAQGLYFANPTGVGFTADYFIGVSP